MREQAIYDRRGDGAGDLVHHSDRGTRYLSMRYTERLADAGIALSVGSRGRRVRQRPRRNDHRSVQDGGDSTTRPVTLSWADWFNTPSGYCNRCGYIPPAEYEERYYEQATVA